MRNLARHRCGGYVSESSLSHRKIADTGLVSNSVDGYQAPVATGGTVTFDSINGVKYKTHVFTGSADFVVSGKPRVYATTSVQGGGGGGSYRWNWGEPGGNGGTGGLGTSNILIPSGTNSISVGGGGARAEWNGGSGGTSSGLGNQSTGGGGGSWAMPPNHGGAGSFTAVSGSRNIIGGWGLNSDKAQGGGGGAGGNEFSGSSGGSGAVVIRYRFSK